MNVNKEDKISEKKNKWNIQIKIKMILNDLNKICRLSLIINSFLKTILSK